MCNGVNTTLKTPKKVEFTNKQFYIYRNCAYKCQVSKCFLKITFLVCSRARQPNNSSPNEHSYMFMNTNSHTKMSATNIADNEEQLIILPSPPTGYLNFSIDGECRQCGEGESTSILKRILQTEYSNMPLDKRAACTAITTPENRKGSTKL